MHAKSHPYDRMVASTIQEVLAKISLMEFSLVDPKGTEIERILASAVSLYMEYWTTEFSLVYEADARNMAKKFVGDDSSLLVAARQFPIENYRTDFCFCVQNYHTKKLKWLAVECDGHDFHERTKAQAAHDRGRDRFMQALGYTVFRFTGSEIWRKPMECAEQIYRWAQDKAFELP